MVRCVVCLLSFVAIVVCHGWLTTNGKSHIGFRCEIKKTVRNSAKVTINY